MDVLFSPPSDATDVRGALRFKRTPIYACEIRPGEIDLQSKFFQHQHVLKAKYELKDGKLRVTWSHKDRPDSFEEAYKDSSVELYVLKKVK